MNQPPVNPHGPTHAFAAPQAPPRPNAPVARPFGEPSREEAMMAAASHGLSFVEGGLLGPLAIYWIKKDESPFVAFHALQSLYFGIIFFALTIMTCGLAAIVLIWPYMAFEALATIKAYEGEWYELPLVGGRALAKHPRPMPPRP